MKTLRALLHLWTWSMAWRDSRRERPRLLIFSLSIIFGVAALVGIGSLNRNLSDAVHTQAKDLLGADLMLSSGRPFLQDHAPAPPDLDPAAATLISTLSADRALEVSFTTMILFGENNDTRLVNIRATDPQFPFYGTVKTAPTQAWSRFQKGEGIILDGALAAQFGITPGDTATIGALKIPILGTLTSSPPQAGAFAAFAPPVFLPRTLVEKTGLTGARSLASYRAYFHHPALQLREDQKSLLQASGLRLETIADRKQNLRKTLDRLTSFFSLTGFTALLLGGIGIASAIHVHISGRLPTLATLRCLGCTPARATAVFLAQGITLGIIGTLAGTALGIALQQSIVRIFRSDFPFPISAPITPGPILSGIATGFFICITFTLLPLLQIRRISPLAALRGSAANTTSTTWRDPARALVLGIIAAALTLLAIHLSPPSSRLLGLGFIVALAAITALLALTAASIMKIVRTIVRPSQPYILRQGLAGLYRPKNQTTLFLLSTGLGTCLILTLYFTQGLITSQLASKTLGGKADTFLIDVQPDQRPGIQEIFKSLHLPTIDEVPMIPMRLTEIKGTPVAQLQKSPTTKIPPWTLRRDFRSTYRSQIAPTEKLLRGQWIPTFNPEDSTTPIPVSIEEGIAQQLKIDLGDQFTMRIGGIPMTLQIANVREVDWDGLDLNFFLVFPQGVLEEAPGFNVITTRTPTDQVTGKLNRAILQQFPNITIFDASQVIDTLQKIVTQIGKIIRITALFTILTGIMILIGTILSGKRDRITESVLLRTLGASTSQIWKILATEYALLGFLAATTGALLALATSWALATFVFELDFLLTQAWSAAIAIGSVTTFTTAVGLALSKGVTRRSPLSVLRDK